MKNKTPMFILLTLVLAAALVLTLYFWGGREEIPAVVLPSPQSGTEAAPEVSPPQGLAVTPENVQAVLRALERPEHYTRTATYTQYYSGTAHESLVTVWKDGSQVRILQLDASGSRNTLLTGGMLYIWYGSDSAVFSAEAAEGDVRREDLYQGLPTYEDVLELAPEEITAAAYTQWGGYPCILAETSTPALGYTIRYYISTDYGLLAGYEVYDGGELLRSLTVDEISTETPAGDIFRVPESTAATADTSRP